MRAERILILCSVLLLADLAVGAEALPRQQPDPASEPFVGVTTDGTVRAGLYSIQATGVSTEPVRLAATTFLNALTDAQRTATRFEADDIEWRRWNNVHRYERAGVGFDEMTDAQREAAFGLLRASLSAEGFEEARSVMKLNGYLADLLEATRPGEYGEWLYWITVMGEPSATQPWGWQLDGHHLVINYFVLGDQVVMTPTFMGSEPVTATEGRFAGTTILRDEERMAQAFLLSLDAAQRERAILETEKPGNNAQAQAFRDNLVLAYAGLRADALTPAQRDALLALIGEYVGNMRKGHARVRMQEVADHLDETWFAWVGGTGPEDAFYYRIQSPVILIEFDHQRPVALPGERVPSRRHVHSVVRTPNGNDYGKDLLRQHYEAHRNDTSHGH